MSASTALSIRPFQLGDETALLKVFQSSVHLLATQAYTPEQVHAWAPPDRDADEWRTRMQTLRPFVVTLGDEIIAYADLQADGLIDHFFVAGPHAGQGIGDRLMRHLITEADRLGLDTLHAHVSLNAQSFFAKHGFHVLRQGLPVLRAVAIPNALMQRRRGSPGAPAREQTS